MPLAQVRPGERRTAKTREFLLGREGKKDFKDTRMAWWRGSKGKRTKRKGGA